MEAQSPQEFCNITRVGEGDWPTSRRSFGRFTAFRPLPHSFGVWGSRGFNVALDQMPALLGLRRAGGAVCSSMRSLLCRAAKCGRTDNQCHKYVRNHDCKLAYVIPIGL